MGTSGKIIIIANGKKTATYNHFDSYPSHLGNRLVNQILHLISAFGLEKVLHQWSQCKIITDGMKPTEEDVAKLKPYTNLGVSEQSTDDWYCLTHGTQGDMIAMLHCGYIYECDYDWVDYVYIVDWDAQEFTILSDVAENPRIYPFDKLYRNMF